MNAMNDLAIDIQYKNEYYREFMNKMKKYLNMYRN